MGKVIKQPLEALKEYFGFDSFLDGQESLFVISCLLFA